MAEEKPGKNTELNDRGPDHGDWRERRGERRERGYRDPLRGLFWGLILILVGVLFFINQQQGISWEILWKYILIGLGAIFIIDGLAHFRISDHGNLGRFIPGVILLFVGLAFLYSFGQWWPVILIAVGVVILISFLFRRR